LYDRLLEIPVTGNKLSMLLLLVLAPHAYEQQKGDHDKTMEVLKGYLEKVSRIRPLRPFNGYQPRGTQEGCSATHDTRKE
jgi:hypothetical protein